MLIIAVVGTHDDESDRVVMEVLKDVIKDDLEDEAHETYIFQGSSPLINVKSAIIISI